MSLQTVSDFLDPVSLSAISGDEGFKHTQLGRHVAIYDESFPDVTEADVVLIGCGEMRGAGPDYRDWDSADSIRREFYALYHWHESVRLADLGNIRRGASLQDTYAALKTVVTELVAIGKKVVILGGSHDITLAQYQAQAGLQKLIEVTCIDAGIDLDMSSPLPSENFLMEMLTGEPNYIRHYNHIGFQSYLVHPQMLQTIDKLHFDCYRVGRVKENLEEMEPVIRNSNLLSVDISAIQHAHAPANKLTPNGFTGEEMCTLMQYAGLSPSLNTLGIYGYYSANDEHSLTAKQISHMLWYFMDGLHKGKEEASFEDRNSFHEFHLAFAEVETIFLQSKRTGRWWMQLPSGQFTGCSKNDYIIASSNDIPERWLRAVERDS